MRISSTKLISGEQMVAGDKTAQEASVGLTYNNLIR